MVKIIVKNEEEKELIEDFLNALCEQMLDTMEYHDHTQSIQDGEPPYLNSYVYKFIENGMYNAKVLVNEFEKPMVIESYDIIGLCKTCGVETSGTIDGNDIDYNEWLRLTSKESIDTWKCESCYFKEEE